MPPFMGCCVLQPRVQARFARLYPGFATPRFQRLDHAPELDAVPSAAWSELMGRMQSPEGRKILAGGERIL
jgi:hypothetical protein